MLICIDKMRSTITEEQFDKFIANVSPNFIKVQVGMETAYKAPLKSAPAIEIMILSSISVRSKVSRSVGTDAIRVILTHNGRIIGSGIRTHRTPRWEERLKLKMIDLGQSIDKHRCPRCSGYLIKRKKKKSIAFLGCTNYPLCKFSKSADVN